MTATLPSSVQLRIPRLLEWQRDVDQNPARFQVLACGRRVGKTTYAKRRLAKTALKTRQPYAYFAPTYKMLAEVWRGLVRGLRDVTAQKLEQEKQIVLLSGGVLDFWSLENPDAARGRKYAGVVIDEAAMVRDLSDVWNAVIRPLLTDYQGWAMFPSTPRGRNGFFELYQRGIDPLNPEWAAWRLPTSANPLISPVEIEAARQELPERFFAQEYLAEFIEDSGLVFRRVYDCATLEPQSGPIPGHLYIMGLDWGKDNDYTAIAVLDATARQLAHLERFREIGWSLQRGRLAALAAHWRPDYILAEENSIGGPNIEALQAEGLPVYPFTTTASSKGPLIESLALAFERGEIGIIDDPVLIGELLSYEMQRLPSGRFQYSAPVGMHDDTVIALALGWYGVMQSMGFILFET